MGLLKGEPDVTLSPDELNGEFVWSVIVRTEGKVANDGCGKTIEQAMLSCIKQQAEEIVDLRQRLGDR